MARDLPLGNGELLVDFDVQYRVRDFYYPRVGGENHTDGYPFRFGVWCDGQFGWVHEEDWQRTLDYEDATMVTKVTLGNARLQLSMLCNDTVDFEESLYLRRIHLENTTGRRRDVRLFLHHDFHISGSEVGDTAFYDPQVDALLHYKGKRYFLINALTSGGSGLSDYATGLKDIYGLEGTWRDAEDGLLGKNPIAQGSVDSTVGIAVTLEPGEATDIYYWIGAGTTYSEVAELNQRVLAKTPAAMFHRAVDYWHTWVNQDRSDFDALPEDLVRLYKHSLLILRTQTDNRGAIIASNDSDLIRTARDTYCYCWPRDGALSANALDLAGHDSLSLAFFRFCRPLLTRGGFLLHKYNPDGSLGSSWHPWLLNGESVLPIQEDETALVLWALWQHYEKYRDMEEVLPLYRDLIVPTATFMASYIDEAHDLPLPSYDLWEQRRGIHAWTVGTVYGGLQAAARFAAAFGEHMEASRFSAAAERIRSGAERHLWRNEAGRFVRTITFAKDGTSQIDWTLDASLLGLFLFGMYEARDPRLQATVEAVHKRLWIQATGGGMARFEQDTYCRPEGHPDFGAVPGNPWFVCTLWMAKYRIARAQTLAELEEAFPILRWCADHALPSGVLAEQVDPYTNRPNSVSPLTWSHAGFVTTVQHLICSSKKLGLSLSSSSEKHPRSATLTEGSGNASASIFPTPG